MPTQHNTASGLTYEVHGHRTAATPVLLSSGLGGTAGFWRPQLDALLDAGHCVIAYDQRGTGRSPAQLPEPYTIQDMADDVVEILDHAGLQTVHLVGHALGGLVGLSLAAQSPARLASLTLINAWSKPNPHSARCFDSRLLLLAAGGAAAYVAAQPIFLYPAAWSAAHDDEVRAEVAHGVAHFQGEQTLRARIGALRRFDLDAQLTTLHLPVLVSTAQDDALVPWTCSQRLAQALPNARWHAVAHGGHAHNVTDADTFNQVLLDFLARQTPTMPEQPTDTP